MANNTQLQQALALRKSNPNLSVADAVSQVRANAPIANAPVAGQAPAITQQTPSVHDNPTYQSNTTEQFNQNQLAKNQAKVQGEIASGERPAVGTQATPAQVPEIVQQNQPVQTPVTPAPVNQAETPKAETPTPTTPTAQVAPVKTPTTPQVTTPTVVTPRDTIANQTFAKYNAMTSQQYIDLMKQGKIPSTIGSQLAQTNPQYQQAQAEYAKIQKVNNLNQSYQAVANGLNGVQSAPTKNPLQEISDKYMSLFQNNQSYAEAFKQSLAQNDTLRTKTQELNAKQGEINTKVQQRDKLLQDYKNQYKDVPLSILVAMASRDAKPINDEIATMQNERDVLKADVDYETQLAKGEYDAKVKDMETQQTLKNAVLSQVMGAEFGMATKQAEVQMEQTLKEQALKDPATAVTNLVEEYKKMGIPFQRSTLELIQEAQNVVNSGGSLAGYLTELQGKIQSKPEYIAMQKAKANEGVSYQQFGDTVYKKMPDGSLVKTDISTIKSESTKAPSWKQDIDGNWYNENSSVPPNQQVSTGTVDIGGSSYIDSLGKNVGTYTGNRGYDLAGNIGDPILAGGSWKVISTDTAGEQKGSIFVAGKGAKPYGNTVVMEDENGNKIRFSHLDSINVKKDDVLGFGSVIGTRGNTGHVLGKNGETLTPEQLAQGRGAHVDIEIKDSSGRLLSNEEQKKYLEGIKPINPLDKNNLSIYRSYVEDGKLPSKDALKGMKMNSQQFINNAESGYNTYLDSKAKEISNEYPTLDIAYNSSTYSANSPTQKEKLNDSITKIGDIDFRMNKLKKLFDENGTEVLPTKAKAEMDALRQQIILKAKEVENLGVLNGPDLGILENLIPSTTGLMSGAFSFDSNTMAKLTLLQSNYRNDAKTKAVNYGAKLSFVSDPVEKEIASSWK